MKKTILILCVLACEMTAMGYPYIAPQVSSTSWPMFRGEQDLCGIAPGKLTFPLKLRWTASLGGQVKASAAIEKERVFIASTNGTVCTLDLTTGTTLWTAKVGKDVESSPLVCAGEVFLGDGDGILYAFNVETGKERWRYATGGKITGAPNWISFFDHIGILAGSYDNKVHCVAFSDGKALWSYDTGNYINGAVAVAGEKVVFGGCDGKIHMLTATDGTLQREKQRTIEAGGYVAGSCAVKSGSAYAGHYNNEVVCADLETGKIVWRFKEAKEPFFSSPAVTEDRILIGCRDKKLYCLDRKTGALVWAFATQGNVDSSPVVCGDAVLVGSNDGRLYALDLATGKQLWSYDIGKPITASPAVAGGLVIIGSEDGTVYAFKSE